MNDLFLGMTSLLVTIACAQPQMVLAERESTLELASAKIAQTLDISVKVVEVARIDPDLLRQRQNVVENYDRSFRAYTIPSKNPQSQGLEQIVVESLKTRKTFVIQGLPPLPRPFSHLVWVDGYKLSVERWSNPNFGYRYIIDLRQKRLLEVSSIAS